MLTGCFDLTLLEVERTEPPGSDVSVAPNSPAKILDLDVEAVMPVDPGADAGTGELFRSVEAPLSRLLGVRIPSMPSLNNLPSAPIGRLNPVRAASPVRWKKARVSSAREAAIGVNGSAFADSSPGPAGDDTLVELTVR